VFIFIIPGIICYALAVSGRIPALQQAVLDTNGNVIRENAQQAFPLMIAHVLPVGVRGMVVAGLLAALMSSLAGAFNASATLFTIDFYARLRPETAQERLVWVGRVATAVMVLIGILWIPVIQGGKGLYDYLQGVQAYLAPPIFVVFFFGVFWKRLNAKGCMAALVTGFAMGVFRLAIDTPVKLMDGFRYAEGSFLWVMNNVFFQYYSLVIFLVSATVMVVVSYATDPPALEKISGLTYGTVTEEHRKESRTSWDARDVAASALVLLLILAAYVYFVG
jgi:SSS family solute:Na+ symporter